MNSNCNSNHHHRRKARRNEGKAIAVVNQVEQKIDAYQDNLDRQTAIATRAIYLAKRSYQQYYETSINLDEEYRNPNIRQAMTLYTVLLGACAVLVINLLLIKAPVEYIVKQSGASGLWQTFAAFVVPVFLLIFEFYTGAQLQESRRIDDEDAERTWERIGWFLIFFTPLLILGTYIAGGTLTKPFNWVLMVTLMILAGGTDAAIINGYELIDMARGFTACRISLALSKKNVYRQEEKFTKANNNVVIVFNRLGRLYERHNNRYPQAIIPALSFAHTTGWFVNYARGDEAIAMLPPRPPELDFEFFSNLEWGKPLPRRPQDLADDMGNTRILNPSLPTSHQLGGIPEDANEATAAGRDYYRDQLHSIK